ncbi:hypothetical protein ACHAQH_006017 [Verticillium albo-atrum]
MSVPSTAKIGGPGSFGGIQGRGKSMGDGAKRMRRLARRGGVKRISASIYDEIRQVMRARLERILRDCVEYVDYRNAKTVTVHDVIFTLRRIGQPIYGFDPETNIDSKTAKRKD